MTDLSALKERLERAERPSAELDRLIARATGWHRVEPRFTRNKAGGWIAPEDWIGAESDGRPMLDSLHGTTIYREPPRVTGSVDAALALLERKFPGALYEMKALPHRLGHGASLWSNDPAAERMLSRADAPTAPLALCIAIVTALQEQEQTNG